MTVFQEAWTDLPHSSDGEYGDVDSEYDIELDDDDDFADDDDEEEDEEDEEEEEDDEEGDGDDRFDFLDEDDD